MGMKRFSSSSHDKKISRGLIHFSKDRVGEKLTIIESKTLPNPKPDNYKIIRHQQIGTYLIVEIKYLDCTNYEGRKILLFDNCTMEKLKEQKLIDPHFSENKKYHSPIARFEPTERGWLNAIKLTKP